MNRFNHGHVEGTLVAPPIIKKGGVAHFVELLVRAYNDSADTSYGNRMRKDRVAAITLYVHDAWFDRSDYESMVEGATVSCDYAVDSTEYKGRWYTKLRTSEVTVAGITYPKLGEMARDN
ncbi:MAG: hypothetical protein IKF78_09865 [Atopobiaceae bacterium]|nr:hypothetical protein [Atopobiaceae bacterium]